MRLRSVFALTAVLLVASPVHAEDAPPKKGTTEEAPPKEEKIPPPPRPAIKSFKSAEAKKHLYHLASKKMEGRASGLPGADRAGEYLIEQLKEWGYDAAGEDSTFKQFFTVRLAPFPGQPLPKGVQMNQPAKTFNVLGRWNGSDPKLVDEYVVLSAHYDHTGVRNKKKVFLGADDNASGTTALLEVAQAFATEGVPRPKRSILLLFCTGEERGLLGSKHFVNNPTVPLKDIVCDLNIDMVGRNDKGEMHVYGNACSPDLDAAHNRAAEISGLKFTAKTGSIFRRSDQFNFYEKGIPAIFWTSGLHKDYHSTKDEPKKIVYSKVTRAGVHAFAVAWEIANRTERPRFVKMDANASTGPLGAILDMIPAESVPHAKLKDGEGVVLVRSVMDDSPAQKAKLKNGDLIIGIGKRSLPDSDPVGAVEETAAKKKKMSLRVVRGTKRLRLHVKF